MLILIMKWYITYFNKKVFKSVQKLPMKLKARFVALTDRMQTQGLDLGMPHTRFLKNGLFELRLKADEGIARVFYASVINGEIIILHAFIKKTQRIPVREMQIATRRLREVVKNERKK